MTNWVEIVEGDKSTYPVFPQSGYVWIKGGVDLESGEQMENPVIVMEIEISPFSGVLSAIDGWREYFLFTHWCEVVMPNEV